MAQSHQISKSRGDSTGHKQEVCPASSAHPLCQPQSCTPKPGQGDGVHEDALPKWGPLPKAAASYSGCHTAGPAIPMALLFPGVPRLLLTLQPPGPKKTGQCLCQPGSSGESKTNFANTAEITGFISRHMAVSSGREEATAGLLAKFLVFLEYLHVVHLRFLFSLWLLAVAGWRSLAGGGQRYPAHSPCHANYRQPVLAISTYNSLLPDLNRTANKNLAFLNTSIKHHSLPLEITTEFMEHLGEKEPTTEMGFSSQFRHGSEEL